MPQSELNALIARLRRADPYDRGTLAELAAGLAEVRANLPQSGEVQTLMEAAAALVETLSGPSNSFERDELQSITTLLLATIERAIEVDPCLSPEPASPAPSEVTDLPPLEPLGTGRELSPPEAELALRVPLDSDTSALGRIMMALGYVFRTQVADALRLHRSKGLALGECLLILGATSPKRLLEALRIQERMRIDEVDAEEAERRLEPGAPAASQRRPAKAPLTHDLFLGEILLGAEMISNEDLEQAMHVHHHEGVPVGEALIRAGCMTTARLEYGLELQRRLRNLPHASVA